MLQTSHQIYALNALMALKQQQQRKQNNNNKNQTNCFRKPTTEAPYCPCIYLSVYVYIWEGGWHAHHSVQVESEHTMWELVLSFHHVASRE